MMKSLRSRALMFAAVLTLTLMSSAQAEDWNNPGEGDWFDPTNWTPNAVPTDTTDANINNGGTAVLGEDAVNANARNLNVGVDGGEGEVRLQDSPFGIDIVAEEGIRIGVTENGAAASNGRLSFIDTDRTDLIASTNAVPFLLGVSTGAGAANGQLITSGVVGVINIGLPSADQFSLTQIGVAEGGGDASGVIEPRDVVLNTPILELGVSRGAGSAQGRVLTDEQANRTRSLSVGVATDAGDADGWIRTGIFLRGISGPLGDAQVGVSAGSGQAVGVVDLRRTATGNIRSFGPFQQLDIGVSNDAGDASGTVLTGAGLAAQTLNLGISNSTGTGTGLIRTDHGFSDFGAMNLGSGATVLLNAGSNVRGSESDGLSAYGAINTDTAVLDGTLIVDFDYIPDGGERFELINSSAADGLDGDFAAVEVRNLNPGLSFTSGVVLDGGVEKYVLDLTGTPGFAEWTDPGADDWFDPANWSSGVVPGPSDPVLILNGGEARTDAATAPGPLQAFQFGIGVDGGTGSLTVDGVDLETNTNVQVGVIRSDHAGGGSAQGSARFADAELRSSNLSAGDDDPPPPVPTGRITSIGAAYTTGSAEGSLTLDNVNHALGVMRAGHVEIDDADTNAIASAEASLTAMNGTSFSSDLRAARVELDADGASGTATAEVQLSNAVVGDFFSISELDADGVDSSANASATVAVSDTIFNDNLDFVDIEADGENSSAVTNVTATLDRVSIDGSVRLTECDAAALGAQVLPSTALVSVTDSVIGTAGDPAFFDLSEVETDDDGVADCTGRADFVNTELILDPLDIADGDAEDTSTAMATAEVTVTGGSLTVTRVRIGEADVEDDGVAIVDGRLWLVNTTANASEEIIVGFYDDDGAAPGNSVTARLGLTSSALDTPLLQIGAENPASLPLDAEVSLNPSYIRTDDLQLGEQSRIVLMVEGPTRATRDNLDQSGLYAAIDTGAAMLEGEVIVNIRYPAEAGEVFDVLRTDPGALGGSSATFQITSALPGEAQIDIVSEGGQDVLRVTVTSSFAPLIVSVNHPLALIVLVLLLALIGVFFSRARLA